MSRGLGDRLSGYTPSLQAAAAADSSIHLIDVDSMLNA
jgi:hypothetical protein